MDNAAEVFRILADGTRRGLFERLSRDGELSVGALTAEAGVSQPAVSQHLKALRGAGLVDETRVGRTVLYRANPKGLKPLSDWMGFYSRFWSERFDALEDALNQMDQ
jgi:DNA-binding transcriptional ArsR family regulator